MFLIPCGDHNVTPDWSCHNSGKFRAPHSSWSRAQTPGMLQGFSPACPPAQVSASDHGWGQASGLCSALISNSGVFLLHSHVFFGSFASITVVGHVAGCAVTDVWYPALLWAGGFCPTPLGVSSSPDPNRHCPMCNSMWVHAPGDLCQVPYYMGSISHYGAQTDAFTSHLHAVFALRSQSRARDWALSLGYASRASCTC